MTPPFPAASPVQTSVPRCPVEQSCPRPEEDHLSGVIEGPVAGPAAGLAGREPPSALGIPP